MSTSTPTAVAVNPQFQQLFDAYAGGNGLIGQHVGGAVMKSIGSVPLVAISGSDIALFLGGEPQIKSFRLSTPGFYELAAIPHLGPAVASLVKMASKVAQESDFRKPAQILPRSKQ